MLGISHEHPHRYQGPRLFSFHSLPRPSSGLHPVTGIAGSVDLLRFQSKSGPWPDAPPLLPAHLRVSPSTLSTGINPSGTTLWTPGWVRPSRSTHTLPQGSALTLRSMQYPCSEGTPDSFHPQDTPYPMAQVRGHLPAAEGTGRRHTCFLIPSAGRRHSHHFSQLPTWIQ